MKTKVKVTPDGPSAGSVGSSLPQQPVRFQPYLDGKLAKAEKLDPYDETNYRLRGLVTRAFHFGVKPEEIAEMFGNTMNAVIKENSPIFQVEGKTVRSIEMSDEEEAKQLCNWLNRYRRLRRMFSF